MHAEEALRSCHRWCQFSDGDGGGVRADDSPGRGSRRDAAEDPGLETGFFGYGLGDVIRGRHRVLYAAGSGKVSLDDRGRTVREQPLGLEPAGLFHEPEARAFGGLAVDVTQRDFEAVQGQHLGVRGSTERA